MIMAAKTKQGDGRKLSPETRAKISAAKTGKKRGRSAPSIANIAAAMKVRKLGAEHRRNISAALKGKNAGRSAPSIAPTSPRPTRAEKKNPEHVAKIAAANRGAWSAPRLATRCRRSGRAESTAPSIARTSPRP